MSDITKNCPFCGSFTGIIIHDARNRFESYQPVCMNEECRAQMPEFHDAKLAVEAWNRRVSDK
jgi:Lar family restriction alleviation protein